MDLSEILANPTLNTLLLAVLASSALITFLNDAVAHLVAKVPVIGGLLALIVRRATPAFWDWLQNAVRESAERAVREADAVATPRTTNAEKKATATEALAAAQPGLTASQLDVEIEAALARVKADAARAAAKVTPAVLAGAQKVSK